mmetsp:Transcript_93482/g.263934  ORF Transcript_93482/g.263934 Transcript_93482/m.263934 type:complete len:260 (+) Transcript_93482:500-1279(+)
MHCHCALHEPGTHGLEPRLLHATRRFSGPAAVFAPGPATEHFRIRRWLWQWRRRLRQRGHGAGRGHRAGHRPSGPACALRGHRRLGRREAGDQRGRRAPTVVARLLHGPSEALEGRVAFRPARHREDDAREGGRVLHRERHVLQLQLRDLDFKMARGIGEVAQSSFHDGPGQGAVDPFLRRSRFLALPARLLGRARGLEALQVRISHPFGRAAQRGSARGGHPGALACVGDVQYSMGLGRGPAQAPGEADLHTAARRAG